MAENLYTAKINCEKGLYGIYYEISIYNKKTHQLTIGKVSKSIDEIISILNSFNKDFYFSELINNENG